MEENLVLGVPELLLHIFTLILIFVAFLFVGFLLTVKTENKISNVLLAIFLFIRGLDHSSFFYTRFFDVNPILDMLRHDMGGFLEIPVLYLYVLSIVYVEFKLKPKHIWHALPFLINTLVMFPRFYAPILMGEAPTASNDLEGSFTYIFATLQRLAYIVATFWVLNKYKKILVENYSITDKSNYTWLFQINVIVSIIFLAALVKNVYKFTSDLEYLTEMRLVVLLLNLGLICWLILKAMYTPKVFRGVDANIPLVSSLVEESQIPQTIDQETQNKIDQLLAHMEENEPYLNPHLTIQEVATELNLPVTDLSLLINHTLDQNFYEFVNAYRLSRAEEILKDPAQARLTILEILYQVGFNSKSSFNTSFKKKTGLTPTAYRNQHA